MSEPGALAAALPVSGPRRLSFDLPPELEATSPPEYRGLARDEVRLMVAHRACLSLEHQLFRELPEVLVPGDLLVVNTSATIPAALPGRTPDGEPLVVHLSGSLPAGLWLLEVRRPGPGGDLSKSTPWLNAPSGLQVELPEGGRVTLLAPSGRGGVVAAATRTRLWVARLELKGEAEQPVCAYLAHHGSPVRYSHLDVDLPISFFQTVFADQPGSAEMPSAARPFSAEVVARLAARGIVVAPFVLHTGVSSPETGEPPPTEWYRVPEATAELVNSTRRRGGRVIAVGTTAVRALESVADERGRVHPGEGWTDLVVTPERGVTSVDGLITGWHEPAASHLELLEAVAGRELLEVSYAAALKERYLWHEFGDSHLILP